MSSSPRTIFSSLSMLASFLASRDRVKGSHQNVSALGDSLRALQRSRELSAPDPAGTGSGNSADSARSLLAGATLGPAHELAARRARGTAPRSCRSRAAPRSRRTPRAPGRAARRRGSGWRCASARASAPAPRARARPPGGRCCERSGARARPPPRRTSPRARARRPRARRRERLARRGVAGDDDLAPRARRARSPARASRRRPSLRAAAARSRARA